MNEVKTRERGALLKPFESPIQCGRSYEVAAAFLLPLSADYPHFNEWYWNKVIPGLQDESRKIVYIERCNKIVGIGIAKSTQEEKKICTVRVSPTCFGKGFGIKIFEQLLDWLNDSFPVLSVNEKKLPEFQRIFDYYGFEMTSIRNGIYVSGQNEIFFNEREKIRN